MKATVEWKQRVYDAGDVGKVTKGYGGLYVNSRYPLDGSVVLRNFSMDGIKWICMLNTYICKMFSCIIT